MPAPKTPPAGISFTLESNITEVTAEVEAALHTALNRIAIAWHRGAREAAPVNLGRLRASITFSTPTQQNPVTYAKEDGRGVERFTPPKPEGLGVIVGSNVSYAPAVHEGINTPGGDTVEVKAHKVKAHTRTVNTLFGRALDKPLKIKVPAHTRAAHTRKSPPINRAGIKFIEGPGRYLHWHFREIVGEELAKL